MSNAVHRWNTEIQEGINNMLQLLIDLVVARLQHLPVHQQLMEVLCMVSCRFIKIVSGHCVTLYVVSFLFGRSLASPKYLCNLSILLEWWKAVVCVFGELMETDMLNTRASSVGV